MEEGYGAIEWNRTKLVVGIATFSQLLALVDKNLDWPFVIEPKVVHHSVLVLRYCLGKVLSFWVKKILLRHASDLFTCFLCSNHRQ